MSRLSPAGPWLRMGRRTHPGSRDALLSSDAWSANLAGWALCRRRERYVNTHGERDTPAQPEIGKETKLLSTREMASEYITPWKLHTNPPDLTAQALGRGNATACCRRMYVLPSLTDLWSSHALFSSWPWLAECTLGTLEVQNSTG